MKFRQSNWLIDSVMPNVPANAFKVIAFVARKTWGWEKERKAISLEDFRRATGVSSKQTAARAVEDALGSGYIQRAPVANSFEYWPVMNGTESVPENGTEIGASGAEELESRYRNQGINGTEIGAISGTDSVPNQSSTKEEEKENNTGDEPLARVATVYENEFGSLTPFISQALIDSVDEYGEEWVKDAIRESVENNVRKWKYAHAILKRWAAEGRHKAYAAEKSKGAKPLYQADEDGSY